MHIPLMLQKRTACFTIMKNKLKQLYILVITAENTEIIIAPKNALINPLISIPCTKYAANINKKALQVVAAKYGDPNSEYVKTKAMQLATRIIFEVNKPQ